MKRYHLLLWFIATILIVLTACSSTTVTNTVTETQGQTLTETQTQTQIETETQVQTQTQTRTQTQTQTTTQITTVTPQAITETFTQTTTVVSRLEHNTDYQIIRDIEYCQVGERNLVLDIYIPDEPIISPGPAVVWIHGGGWRAGGKSINRDYILMLVEHGFALVSIEYRLSSEAIFPAAVEDSKCAVRWLRAHAQQYNIDPERIGVWGSSAGGHLAMMVACADETSGLEGDGGWEEFSSQVQAVCSWFGPSDLKLIGEDHEEGQSQDSAVFEFIGGLPSELPELYQLASPINHVTGDDPPLLLVHGDMDPVVSLRQSRIMHQAYLELGLETELIVINGAGHGLNPKTDNPISPSQEVLEQIVTEFFIEHLVIQVSNN